MLPRLAAQVALHLLQRQHWQGYEVWLLHMSWWFVDCTSAVLHPQMLNEVIDEAAVERRRAVAAKEQRAAAEARKRERLKAALLKKQLEALKQQRGGAQAQQQEGEQQVEQEPANVPP
jgi:hypothetical protein